MTTARRAVTVGVVSLLLGCTFVTARLASAGWDPSWFVFAGDRLVDAETAPPSLHIRQDSVGFDGAGFYRIALDPFTRERTDFGITLVLPSFRLQRIGYPLVVWATTQGDPEAVAWGLIAWNLAGMAALGVLGALLAKSSGRSEWWGLPLALTPAFALSLGLDTAEILAGVGLFLGLLLLRRERWTWAAVALCVAALTRETTLIVPIAGVLVWLWRRVRRVGAQGPPVWVFILPGAVHALWQAVLWQRWGVIPMLQGSSVDIGIPFEGLASAIGQWLPPAEPGDIFHVILATALALFTLTVARTLRSTSAPTYEKVAWVLMAAAMPLFDVAIWFHHWGFVRALSEFTVLGVLLVLSDVRAAVHRLTAVVAIWVSIALQLALYP